jgi:hypothetical protein
MPGVFERYVGTIQPHVQSAISLLRLPTELRCSERCLLVVFDVRRVAGRYEVQDFSAKLCLRDDVTSLEDRVGLLASNSTFARQHLTCHDHAPHLSCILLRCAKEDFSS